MAISGDLVATGTYPGVDQGVHTDNITIATNLSAGDWIMLDQLGGYPWFYGLCIPPQDDPPVDNMTFGDLQSSAFIGDPVSQLNVAVGQLGFISDPDAVCPQHITSSYVTFNYPNLASTGPGQLGTNVSTGSTMGIEWSGGEKRWDGYAAFITRINAPFDPDGGSGGAIYLNGSAPDMNGDTFNIASGTTSPDAVTTAATDADSGHGAIAIVSVSWDDISLTPSITSGWTLLGTYADPTTTYAGLVAGRIFDAGDTGTYTFNATFSSSVLSETVIDTYQSALTGGVHISQRF